MSNRESGKRAGRDLIRSRETSAIAFVVMAENEMIDDITILENSDLFIQWDEHFRTDARNVIVSEVVDGEVWLFRNVHPIIDGSQNIRPSRDNGQMWTRIGRPGEEYPEWVRPLGAHDAYMAGARVTHNGKRWVNTHGNFNTWEPGIFGWSEV